MDTNISNNHDTIPLNSTEYSVDVLDIYDKDDDAKRLIIENLQIVETLDDDALRRLYDCIKQLFDRVSFIKLDDQDDGMVIQQCLQFLWDQYQETHSNGQSTTTAGQLVPERLGERGVGYRFEFPSTRKQLSKKLSSSMIVSLYESLALDERWEELKVVQKYLYLGLLGSNVLNRATLEMIDKVLDQYPSALFENNGEGLFGLKKLMHRRADDGLGLGVVDGSFVIKKVLNSFPLALTFRDEQGCTLFHRSMGAFAGSGDSSDRFMAMRMAFFGGYNNKDNDSIKFMKYLTVAAFQIERVYNDLGDALAHKGLIDRTIFDSLIRSCLPNPLLSQNYQRGSTPLHDLIQSSKATFGGYNMGGQRMKVIDDETLESLIVICADIGGQSLLQVEDMHGNTVFDKAVECHLSTSVIDLLEPTME